MKAAPIHVVVYTDAEGWGGAEISLSHLVATVSADFKITVVGTCAPIVTAIATRRSGTTVHVIPLTQVFNFPLLLHTFYRLNPDIIHCNLCTPWACASALTVALLLPQVRIVRVDQLPLRTTDAFTLLRTRFLSLRVDAHVAVGMTSARRMEDFYALGRHTVRSIPNGVPDPFLAPVKSSPAAEIITVGSIGRLDAMKGHDILLQAIAQVTGVRVVILGEGEQRAALVRLAADLGISHRLDLPGWMEQPQTYLPQFDIVVLPSRSEGFPLAMVEAMLAARPIIATQVGSMPEAIIDGETGILIKPQDITGLVKALCYLRDHPEVRIRLGTQARALALSQFTAEKMAQNYEQLWQKLINCPRSPRGWIPRPRD